MYENLAEYEVDDLLSFVFVLLVIFWPNMKLMVFQALFSYSSYFFGRLGGEVLEQSSTPFIEFFRLVANFSYVFGRLGGGLKLPRRGLLRVRKVY